MTLEEIFAAARLGSTFSVRKGVTDIGGDILRVGREVRLQDVVPSGRLIFISMVNHEQFVFDPDAMKHFIIHPGTLA